MTPSLSPRPILTAPGSASTLRMLPQPGSQYHAGCGGDRLLQIQGRSACVSYTDQRDAETGNAPGRDWMILRRMMGGRAGTVPLRSSPACLVVVVDVAPEYYGIINPSPFPSDNGRISARVPRRPDPLAGPDLDTVLLFTDGK